MPKFIFAYHGGKMPDRKGARATLACSISSRSTTSATSE